MESASLSTLLSEEYVTALCFSPDSRRLVTVNNGDGTIQLWDLTGSALEPTSLTLRGHEGRISAITLNNRWLVTGGEDSTARVWDLTEDDPTPTAVVLQGHEQTITGIAISADSRWLVTGSKDGTARVWRLQVNDLMELACQTAGRNLSYDEWQKYFSEEEYRETCPDLPVHWSVDEKHQ
jgi:WD40 repeat protein